MTLLFVREAVVQCADLEAAVTFHDDVFGFVEISREAGEVVMGAPGADSGLLRLREVAAPGWTDPAVWDIGPRLFGMYSRDLAATSRALVAAGGTVNPIVTYPYGEATMSETLGYGRDGVWWTIPLAQPGRHRPSRALEADPDRLHSELHTVVLIVDDHDDALAFFTAGGLTTVFDGEMVGPDFETLVGLPEGATLRLSFLSGPEHLPTRLELMSFVGPTATDRRGDPLGIRRVVYVCDDVDATRAALVGAGAQEQVDGVLIGPAGIEIELVAA